jgi:hypothetical protein
LHDRAFQVVRGLLELGSAGIQALAASNGLTVQAGSL